MSTLAYATSVTPPHAGLISLKAYRGPKILLLNNKGGVGKSTLTTQLLLRLQQRGQHPALVDFDPQCSSLQWAEQHGAIWAVDDDARRAPLESMRLRVPANASCVLMDSPANLTPELLVRVLRYADKILLPSQANPMDVRALGRFLPELLFHPMYRSRQPKIGVVANRVQDGSQTELLKRFLTHLDMPLLAELPERSQYQQDHAASKLSDNGVWARLLEWLDQ
ncbi:ParA family protein [Ferrimonas pelagia]|uniref:ParA family protein n=1 Tax=Ferrimonas pelagia TaxID=1177826 RepID=A0ABP9FH80_9GAMM